MSPRDENEQVKPFTPQISEPLDPMVEQKMRDLAMSNAARLAGIVPLARGGAIIINPRPVTPTPFPASPEIQPRIPMSPVIRSMPGQNEFSIGDSVATRNSQLNIPMERPILMRQSGVYQQYRPAELSIDDDDASDADFADAIDRFAQYVRSSPTFGAAEDNIPGANARIASRLAILDDLARGLRPENEPCDNTTRANGDPGMPDRLSGDH